MKKQKLVLLAALALFPASVFALDVCMDGRDVPLFPTSGGGDCALLASNYNGRLAGLMQDIQMRLGDHSLSPSDISAVRQSCETYQLPSILDEARTTMSGCNVTIPVLTPPPPPPPPGDTSGGSTPPPNNPPPTNPPPATDPGTNPGTGGGSGGTVGGDSGGDGGGQACKDQLDAYAQLLKSQHVSQSEFVHKMQSKIHELNCDNYGQWRKCQKGGDLPKCNKPPTCDHGTPGTDPHKCDRR